MELLFVSLCVVIAAFFIGRRLITAVRKRGCAGDCQSCRGAGSECPGKIVEPINKK